MSSSDDTSTTVSRLLKLCATPPASRPIASNWCELLMTCGDGELVRAPIQQRCRTRDEHVAIDRLVDAIVGTRFQRTQNVNRSTALSCDQQNGKASQLRVAPDRRTQRDCIDG